MGIINRVVNAVMTWIVASAGRRAHLAIRLSEINEMQLALRRASELLESGRGSDASLGRRLQDAVEESAGYTWGDAKEETTLLVDFVAEMIARPAINGNGHANGHPALDSPRVPQVSAPEAEPEPNSESDEVFALDAEPDGEPEPTPKRGRGRPRKNAEAAPSPDAAAASSTDDSGTGGSGSTQESPQKRRRGRPRKHPLPPG